MKNIVIIATGGTIAGSGKIGESASYQAGTINVKQIVDSIPQIDTLANLTMIQLCNLDSNDIGISHWKKLREYCERYDKDDSIDGKDHIPREAVLA